MQSVQLLQLTLSQVLLWVAGYLGMLLLCTLLDVVLWRKAFPKYAPAVTLTTEALCFMGYAVLLAHSGFRFLLKLNSQGIFLSLLCAFLFWLVLDKGLDPLLDRLFPHSSQGHEESVASLRVHPAVSFLRICLLAPVMEETLTRGILLGGLEAVWGWPLALMVSAAVFALLHFNLVQTLSALVCGVVLGLLYLYTGSLLCCILAHAAYNCISFFTILRPLHH